MTKAVGVPDPDSPRQSPVKTSDVVKDPGSLPANELAVDPVGANDPEPDISDGEAPQPLSDSTGSPANAGQDEAGQPEHDSATPAFDDDQDDPDALPRGQHGPTLDLGDR